MALTPKPKHASPQQKPRFTLIELLPKARARAGCLRNIYYILCAMLLLHPVPFVVRLLDCFACLLITLLGGGAPVRRRLVLSSIQGRQRINIIFASELDGRACPCPRPFIHSHGTIYIIRCMHTQRSCHLPHTGVAMLAT